jgi:hypothetical protein
MIRPRKIRWAGHVTRMERGGMHVRFWWEIQEEIDHYEDLDVGRRIILR